MIFKTITVNKEFERILETYLKSDWHDMEIVRTTQYFNLLFKFKPNPKYTSIFKVKENLIEHQMPYKQRYYSFKKFLLSRENISLNNDELEEFINSNSTYTYVDNKGNLHHTRLDREIIKYQDGTKEIYYYEIVY